MPDDAVEVAQIWYDGWRDAHLGHVPDELVRVRTRETFDERASGRVADTAVALVEGVVAGFVMILGDEVDQVYVAAPHRGSGVAGALLAQAERLVARAGHREAWLAVVPGNARGRRFYERRGWRDDGVFEHHAPVGEGYVVVPAHRYVKVVDDLPTSARLRYRRMVADDLDQMALLLGDPQVMAFYPRPRSRAEAADWIRWNQDNYARDGFGLWILHDEDGRFVGDCGLTWQSVDGVEDLELGYHVLPARQGEGLATEAAAACRDIARSRGIRRLIAITHPDNAASQRVAEKIGLSFEKRTATVGGMPIHVHGVDLPAQE